MLLAPFGESFPVDLTTGHLRSVPPKVLSTIFPKAVSIMQLSRKISLIADLIRFSLFPARREKPAEARNRKRILVIRLDRIGDFALFLPFAAALRRIYPPETHELTLLGNALWMPLARRMLEFDCFLELAPGKFLRDTAFRRDLLGKIADDRYDLLLQPRFHRELLVEDLIASAAAAPDSLAFSGTTRHIRKKFLLQPWNRPYRRRIDAETLRNTHELIRNRRFFDCAAPGAEPIPNPWQSRPQLPATIAHLAGCTVILPGGGTPGLSWPASGFGLLAAVAATQTGRPIAVAGTAAERETVEQVIASSGVAAANLAGALDVETFAALIANASLVIGNDTGGIHIAALSGVPSLAIAGQGQPGIFHPYPAADCGGIPGIVAPVTVTAPPPVCAGCYWMCNYRDTPRQYECLRDIPPETVVRKLENLIVATRKQRI